MESWLPYAVTGFCAVVASSGFWAVIQRLLDKKDVKIELLIGLAHDRIMQAGMYYIERGYITSDEYENLNDYLYKPYKKMGGNGSAAHIMELVNRLEVRDHFINVGGKRDEQ